MKNNRFKIGVGSVGNLQSSNLKTLLSNPSGFGNYTLVQAEFITERMIHLYAITLGVTPPIQVDGYITYNNVELSWSGWKSYVTNSDFTVTNCSVLTTANQITEIPNCPNSSNYVPVITGYSNTHDYRATISFTNGKWRIFSDVSQPMGISFYRLPSV